MPIEKGIVKWFNKEKGEGIIVTENNQEYFISQENIDSSTHTLEDGQTVQFTPLHLQGKLFATQVSSLK